MSETRRESFRTPEPLLQRRESQRHAPKSSLNEPTVERAAPRGARESSPTTPYDQSIPTIYVLLSTADRVIRFLNPWRPFVTRKSALLSVCLLGALLAGGRASAAPASARPHVSLTLGAPDIEAGQRVTLNYSARGLPRGGHLVLQRGVGTAGVWKTIDHVSGSSGVRREATVGQGFTSYRVLATDPKGRTLATKTTRLTAYAPVSLATILNSSTNTIQAGSTLFRYVQDGSYTGCGCDPGYVEPIFKVTGSTCRAVTLTLAAIANNNGQPSSPIHVSVLSEGADAASQDVASGAISSLNAPVIGDFQANVVVGSNNYLYVDGSADCYTPAGHSD